jgi:hypothetical protein
MNSMFRHLDRIIIGAEDPEEAAEAWQVLLDQRRQPGSCHSSWMWLYGGAGICTRGMPSPSVQKAMLTPSAVLAY